MFDIIIIGAGPAGLTSALYLRRALKKVLVLENKTYGGQIVNTNEINNYPGVNKITGFQFATNLYNQVKKLDTEIRFENVLNIEKNQNIKVITDKNSYETKTLIIATGLVSKKLELENENNLIGKGISYCATCDGALYKDKIVAVVGGGSTALEDALYLSSIAKKVYLIHRRELFRGENTILKKVKEKSNIEILLNTKITNIIGIDQLEKIECNNNKEIKIDGLFICIGKKPKSEIFKDLIDIDENGYIIASEDCKTNTEGIFVAGDIRRKEVRQLVTATADGAVAATKAINYIEENY